MPKCLFIRPKGRLQSHDLCNFYEIDDVYCQIGAHLSPVLRKKIEQGEYVELPKLLKKVRLTDEDHRLQMINKDGKIFFIPASEKEYTTINSL